jgi:hypothetical protein
LHRWRVQNPHTPTFVTFSESGEVDSEIFTEVWARMIDASGLLGMERAVASCTRKEAPLPSRHDVGSQEGAVFDLDDLVHTSRRLSV